MDEARPPVAPRTPQLQLGTGDEDYGYSGRGSGPSSPLGSPVPSLSTSAPPSPSSMDLRDAPGGQTLQKQLQLEQQQSKLEESHQDYSAAAVYNIDNYDYDYGAQDGMVDEDDEDEGAFSWRADATGIPGLDNRRPSELFFLAQLAESTENWADARIFMRQLVVAKGELTDEEQGLLALAYKHMVGKRRHSWRELWDMLQSAEQERRGTKAENLLVNEVGDQSIDEDGGGPDAVAFDTARLIASAGPEPSSLNSNDGMLTAALDIECSDGNNGLELFDGLHRLSAMMADAQEVRMPLAVIARTVREELEELCMELIEMVQAHLLPNVKTDTFETIVFYRKLVGDYYRYLAEHCPDGYRRREFVREATQFYSEALEESNAHIPPANPLRLGLALNISVFYFEILNTPDKACELAKTTYDAAVASIPQGEDPVTAEQKESAMLLELLRENLTIWTLSELSET